MRRVLVCVLLTGMLGFAPAPLPRPSRDGRWHGVDLQALQGTWRVTQLGYTRGDGSLIIRQSRFSHVRVQRNSWTFVGREDDTYVITLDPTKKPTELDLWLGERDEQRPRARGILRRRGDVVEMLYSSTFLTDLPRADSFDSPPAGLWLMTLQRPH